MIIKENWVVYMILCGDATLYTGITNDLAKRLGQHDAAMGAKYLRGRGPLVVVYTEEGHSRSSASRREHGIKRLSRTEKIKLIESDQNHLNGNMLLKIMKKALS